jgi:nitrogen regulation protein NR(I)
MTHTANNPSVLVIDDDSEICYSLQRVLTQRGYDVQSAGSGEEGVVIARKMRPQIVYLDYRMAGANGLEVLQQIRRDSPRSMVIFMTAYGTTQTAIEAMKYGAYDYLMKPLHLEKMITITENALKAYQDWEGTEETESTLTSDDFQEGLVGKSEVMQQLFKSIGQVAASNVTVMITGESGTGKELVARCIYRHSHRSKGPFMAVNCAAIPDNLIESELFGHEKGAFTGATQTRKGRFELCDGGTIFLDEIGDMALPTQTKILRALQEGEIQRVGGSETIKVNVRLIAATNRDLEKMVANKEFREDLYYRLNVMRLRVPHLRERKEDIPLLAEFILQRLANEGKTLVKKISKEAMQRLLYYRWPGNVREMENVMHRSAVIARGDTILLQDLPRELQSIEQDQTDAREQTHRSDPVELPPEIHIHESGNCESLLASLGDNDRELVMDLTYRYLRRTVDQDMLQELEKAMIQRALDEMGGNQVRTARLLGITRATLRKRIEENQ